jgi:hypothetical protein
VFKMCADKMASREGTKEGEFACHDRSSYDTGKLLCVLTRLQRMSAFDSQHLQYSLLRGKDGATTNSTNLYARHCNGD